jgi:hypothetical protein
MGGIKRRRTLSPEASSKSSRFDAAFYDVPDDEEDLASILEKIREQEESEALAKKLQQEFDGPQAAQVIDLTQGDDDTLANNEIGPSTREDDEAMAQRLAREWEVLDAAQAPPTKPVEELKVRNEETLVSTSSKSLRTQQPTNESRSCAPAPMVNPVNPETDLSKHRDLFTRTKECTKCGNDVVPPRNLVSLESCHYSWRLSPDEVPQLFVSDEPDRSYSPQRPPLPLFSPSSTEFALLAASHTVEAVSVP